MNKYIIELLNTESTVIIPEFGALMGSGKSMIFNPILKFNDGKLIKYIAEKEGKSEQDVTNMVAKHVKDINASLDKGEEYIIFGLGVFSKNEEAKIVFKVKDTDEKEVKNEKEIVNQDPEEKKNTSQEEKKITKNEETEEEVKKDAFKEEKKVEKSQEKKNSETPKSIIKPEEEVKKYSSKSSKKVKQKNEKKKKSWVIWLVILIVIFGGGGTFVALKWKEVNAWISSLSSDGDKEITNILEDKNLGDIEDTKNIDHNQIIDSSSNETDTAKNIEENLENEDENKENEIVNNDPIEVSSELKYHITVGAFSNKKNAEKLVSKMRSAGLENARILPGGGLAKVVAGSYLSKQEAKVDLNKAREFNEGAYIIKK